MRGDRASKFVFEEGIESGSEAGIASARSVLDGDIWSVAMAVLVVLGVAVVVLGVAVVAATTTRAAVAALGVRVRMVMGHFFALDL